MGGPYPIKTRVGRYQRVPWDVPTKQKLRWEGTNASHGTSLPNKNWLESRPEYEARLKKIVADINENLDVEGLCYGLPKRLEKIIAASGGRLKE